MNDITIENGGEGRGGVVCVVCLGLRREGIGYIGGFQIKKIRSSCWNFMDEKINDVGQLAIPSRACSLPLARTCSLSQVFCGASFYN